MNCKTVPHIRRALSLLLVIAALLALLPGAALAGQQDEYHDPAEHWLDAANRTNELDVNSVIMKESFLCRTCKINTTFTLYRVPEYTSDGISARTRDVRYSDGTVSDGSHKAATLEMRPSAGGIYTGWHWDKSVCDVCGTFNSNRGVDEYSYGKNVYQLDDCNPVFNQQLAEEVSYSSVDDTNHRRTANGGSYCGFCYGTRYTASSKLEKHELDETVIPQLGHQRFLIHEGCSLCEYEKTNYVTAKSVISNYYGIADGASHTLLITDLSDSGVTTSIRYGNSADACTMLTPPAYTEAGQYTVYYSVTYFFGGSSMTENGVAYVWLREAGPSANSGGNIGGGSGTCACGCGHPADTCDCSDGICQNCPRGMRGHTQHDYVFENSVEPTCFSLGYDLFRCSICGAVEKRNYVPALTHSYTTLVINEADCEHEGKTLRTCSLCGDTQIQLIPKVGHRLHSHTIPASCTGPGYSIEECAICVYRVITDILPVAEHKYVSTTIPAGCETDGRITEVCANCGQLGSLTILPASGHAWDNGSVISKAGCLNDGVTVYRCGNCGEQRYETVPAAGHTHGAGATCTEAEICSACGAILDPAHGHTWAKTVEMPSCTAMGRTIYTCAVCGESYQAEYADALGHQYVALVTAPTCTEAGYTTYTCARCGDSYEDRYVPALGHNWSGTTTLLRTGCNNDGLIEHRCDRCGETYLESVSSLGHRAGPAASCVQPQLCLDCGAVLQPAQGHSYQTVLTPPTCSSMGYRTYTCARCGDSYIADYIPALGHSYKPVVIPATCTDRGYTVYTCSNCGDSYVSDDTEPRGHRMDNGTVLTPASCDHTGVKQYKCLDCGYTELEMLPAAGHTPGAAASCSAPQLCTVCGAVLVGASGHHWNQTVIAPSCTAMGQTRYTCSDCGDSYSSDYTAPLGHQYVEVLTTPTCTASGYSTFICSACGDSYRDRFTAPKGHRLDNGTVISEPACTHSGVMQYKCMDCDYTELVTLPATGHTPGQAASCVDPQLCLTCGAILAQATGHHYMTELTPPTCQKMGYTTYTCTNCGDSFKSDYLDPLGHNYAAEITAPTCTEKGYTTFTCTRCGASYIDAYQDAAGHKYQEERVSPTCTEKGYSIFTCTVCGDSYTDAYIQPKGHRLDNGTVISEPACTHSGVMQYKCMDCDYNELETIPATGHVAGEGASCTEPQLCAVCGTVLSPAHGHNYIAEITAPTCQKMGYTTYTCDDCGDSYKSDYSDPLGHSFEGAVTEPTCTERGFTAFTCQRCGEQYTDELTDPLGHYYEDELVEPTCTENGCTIHTCIRCGDSYTDSYTEAHGHEWDDGERIISATCNGQGLIEHHCVFCDELYLEPLSAAGHNPGPEASCTEMQLCQDCGAVLAMPLGHDYLAEVTEPTCTEQGYTTHLCTRCGDSYVDHYVPALGHDYSDEVTEPTCTEGGCTVHTCAHCGDTFTDSFTEAAGHHLNGGTVILEPGCTHSGVTQYECLACDYTELLTTAPTGHSPGPEADCTEPQLCTVCGAVITTAHGHSFNAKVTAPSCLQMGYTTYTCDDCGESYKSDYTDPLGHDYVAEATEPTCTEQGYTVYTCSRCGDSYIAEYVDAKGHRYEGQPTEATCLEGGCTSYTCADCGDSYVADYTDPLGHEWDEGTLLITAGCTTEGLIDHRCIRCEYHYIERIEPKGHNPGPEADCVTPQICNDCGAVLQDALGHDYVADVTEPTCTEQGYTTYTCTRCGETFTDNYTEAKGHSYEAEVSAPTCLEEGFTTYTCADCGNSYVADHTEALGHEWDEGAVLIAPDCTNEGLTDHHCIRCDYHYIEQTPAKGHTEGPAASCLEPQLCLACGIVLQEALGHEYVEEITAPTCTEQGYTVHTCVRCGDSFTDSYVEAKGHRLDDGTVTKPAEIGKTGEKVYHCLDCDYVKTETLPALPAPSSPGGGSGGIGGGSGSYTPTIITTPVVVTKTEEHGAYIYGYPDGNFRPERSMTRAEASAIFARLLAASKSETIPPAKSSRFGDVSADDWFAPYISYLEKYGIVKGTSDTAFSPNKAITRAEFIALAVRFFDVYGAGDSKLMDRYKQFDDISEGYWAAEYIADAAKHGWIEGYGDGSIRPEASITRAEVVTVVNRLLGRAADQSYILNHSKAVTSFTDVSEKHWASLAIMEAANTHTADMTREEVWVK